MKNPWIHTNIINKHINLEKVKTIPYSRMPTNKHRRDDGIRKLENLAKITVIIDSRRNYQKIAKN